MKIFVSYKREDLEKVQLIVEQLREVSPDIQISLLRESPNWQSFTADYIKKCDMFIYLAGKRYSENIDWEINTALEMGKKVYCIKLDKDVVLDERLYVTDEFDDMRKHLKIEEPCSQAEIVNKILGDREYLSSKIFSSNVTDINVLVEQYKLLLSTSESLIERRQRLTTTYLSIYSALIPVVSIMLSFQHRFLYLGTMIISVLCILLCLSWRNTIISYGRSNGAKFAILEEIERKLPAAIFASEWVALKRTTQQYKSFTSRETMIPCLFIVIYAFFAIMAGILLFAR